MKRIPTGSQTVGPFFHLGLTTNASLGAVAGPAAEGERIRLLFRVIDGDGVPTAGDSMIEIWQADASGRYASGGTGAFQGFGRLETDLQGRCVFETIRPGRVAATDGGLQAPHINVLLFARGLLRHLHTRVYFEGDPANERDPVLAMVAESRRDTLLARRSGSEPAEWQFDIVLQGAGETVFFDV